MKPIEDAPITPESSLLEAVHQKEADVTRRLAAAQQAAQAAVALAQRHAHERVQMAQMQGQQAGEAQGQQQLAQTAVEAAAIIADAKAKIENWHFILQTQMETAVSRAVALVLPAHNNQKTTL